MKEIQLTDYAKQLIERAEYKRGIQHTADRRKELRALDKCRQRVAGDSGNQYRNLGDGRRFS